MSVQHLALPNGDVACGAAIYPGRLSVDHLDLVTCQACRAAAAKDRLYTEIVKAFRLEEIVAWLARKLTRFTR